jgi:uncharacterized membrane protein YedE/YeeE
LQAAETLQVLPWYVAGPLIGFGMAYAGGCSSGHAITGLADVRLPSLVAVIGFFAGVLFSTWVLMPLLLGTAG